MDVREKLNGSKLLVTGGTGSFGNQLVEKLIEEYDLREIVIFSRDEKKQYDMRNKFKNDKLKFIIGDVRDRDSVFNVMKGVDYVFHAAALKQVPTCEFFPYQAVQTNIVGPYNALEAAEYHKVKKVVVLSTDKAVYPINAMGMTKALMEKLVMAKARENNSETVYCAVRYGNVMYSRGSVLPLFMDQINAEEELTVTHPAMTRYLLPLPIAIELVLFALAHGENGDVLVRKSPAATVEDTAQAMINLFNHTKGVKAIGIREGEKMHETLVTQEELMKAEEFDHYYRIRNLSKIDYDKYFVEGDNVTIPTEGYTSANTKRLTVKETEELLLSLVEIKDELSKGSHNA